MRVKEDADESGFIMHMRRGQQAEGRPFDQGEKKKSEKKTGVLAFDGLVLGHGNSPLGRGR
jgi:hypothetical protein